VHASQLIAALLLAVVGGADAAPLDPANLEAQSLAHAIFEETNRVRQHHDRDPLEWSAPAAEAAQAQAEALAAADVLTHGSPKADKESTPFSRLTDQGLDPIFVAENAAFNFLLRYRAGEPFYTRSEDGETVRTFTPGGEPIEPHSPESFAKAIVEQWMNSPEHRKNLLSPEPSRIGIGCALSRHANRLDTIYAVQDFLRPR
jgi:uncharacterized protein YkwD